MDETQKEALHQWLIEHRKRLLVEIAQRDDARVEDVQHSGDLSHLPSHPADHDAEGLGVELTVGATLREELRAIEEALDRIRNDENYGQCQRCGKSIVFERLEAVPFTPYCLECEREEETELGEEAAR